MNYAYGSALIIIAMFHMTQDIVNVIIAIRSPPPPPPNPVSVLSLQISPRTQIKLAY